MCAALAYARADAAAAHRADLARRQLRPEALSRRSCREHDCDGASLARARAALHPVAAPELAQHRLAQAQSLVRARAADGLARTGARSPVEAGCARPRARAARPLRMIRFRLDPVYVVVGEAEMVVDLVDEDVAHEVGQVLAGFAPIVEQRPSVEEDHVEMGDDAGDALARKIDAAIEAEQVELGLAAHLVHRLLVGKIDDADHDIVDMPRQLARHAGIGHLGDDLEVLDGRRLGEGRFRVHFGASLSAPSRRTTSPLSIVFSIMCSTSRDTSWACPRRCGNGTESPSALWMSGGRFSIIGVAIRPGATANTRMPLRARSRAAGRVRPAMP